VKKLVSFVLIVLMSLPAVAVDGDHVKYFGGTAPGVSAGVVGRLDTTSPTALTFEAGGNKLPISYASIESFTYSKEVARHLGVLPLIAVCLIRMRQHRHFFRITYRGSDGVANVAIFEVPKHMPRTLQAVLDTRSPHADKSCKPCLNVEGQTVDGQN